ncbi:MI domain-containing protein, partial [Haematococcus lacustris]
MVTSRGQERTYKRFFGLLAQRFCYLKREYAENFDQCFRNQYAVIHRLETNKLRNIASLFSHLLATDALSWSVMECMRITEEDTTSASRIFIKYLFQELSSTMGVLKLAARMNDPAAQGWYDNVFPKDTQANLRFAINFFTSIGLGGLTDSMRAHYAE